MRLISRIVPLVVVLLVGLMSGRAEASRIEFTGAGGQGAIVWDDIGDASTMASSCSSIEDCFTSLLSDLLPPGFGVRVTPDSVLPVSISSVHVLLSPEQPVPCGALPDVECGTLAGFEGLFGTFGYNSPDGDVTDSTQFVIRLATILTGNNFYSLTDPSLAYLAAFIANADPATTRVGFDVAWSGDTSLIVETAPASTTPTPVPEPGTLLLLASGLAGMVRYRRRVVR